MSHTGRHFTERARLEHKYAIAVLAFIADFEIALHADEKIIDPLMHVCRNSAAGLDAVHSRLHRRILVPTVALAVVAGAVVLSLQVGTDFFPRVDAGLIQLHVRAPARTRIEHTEQIFQSVEDKIRDVIPKHDLDLVLALADRAYVLDRGRVSHEGPAAPLLTDLELRRKVLWV